jgi:peptidoglycan/LPS O-acetylase OafA/YrhL
VSAISAAAAGASVLGYQWPAGSFATYWIVWVSGAVLAELAQTTGLPRWRTAYWFALAVGLAAAIVLRRTGIAFGFEYLLWGGVYFLLVLWVLHHPHLRSQLPASLNAALLWLGKISYSLYLVHFPFLLVVGAWWVAVFGEKPSSLLVPLIAAFATLPVAYLLWRFVERPAQRLARTLASHSIAAAPDTAAVGFVR